MKRFKIKAVRTSYYFWVYVHDDLRQLRKGAVDYDARYETKHKDTFEDKVMGLCHCYERFKVDPEGNATCRSKNIGIIRLSKTALTTEIVAHELVHAAMHNYRVDHGSEDIYEGTNGNANFGNGCNDEEETYAYLYGELFRNINSKLHKYKLWT